MRVTIALGILFLVLCFLCGSLVYGNARRKEDFQTLSDRVSATLVKDARARVVFGLDEEEAESVARRAWEEAVSV